MMGRARKFRGRSRTHGRGKKGGRGAGLRGGRGNAGLHKHKYLHTVKYMPNHFGRRGFKRPQKIQVKTTVINFREINERFEEFRQGGYVKEEKDDITLDLTAMKIDKLLSKGEPSKKMSIVVKEASSGAKEKIEKSGGKIISV